MLLHAAINNGSGLTVGLVPGLNDEFQVQLYGAVALAFTVAALALVAATRGKLGYRSRGWRTRGVDRRSR